MPPITDAEFRQRARNAVLDVLLYRDAMKGDRHKSHFTFGELLTEVDSRYHLELRDVLEDLMQAGHVRRTTTGDEDRYSLTPAYAQASERHNIRMFLFDAHLQAVAEYKELGGMNDTWDLVYRLEEDGHDMAAIGRLLLAEFLNGRRDEQNFIHFRVGTVA